MSELDYIIDFEDSEEEETSPRWNHQEINTEMDQREDMMQHRRLVEQGDKILKNVLSEIRNNNADPSIHTYHEI